MFSLWERGAKLYTYLTFVGLSGQKSNEFPEELGALFIRESSPPFRRKIRPHANRKNVALPFITAENVYC